MNCIAYTHFSRFFETKQAISQTKQVQVTIGQVTESLRFTCVEHQRSLWMIDVLLFTLMKHLYCD